MLEEGARFSRLPEKGVKDWSVRLPIKCDLLLLRSRCSAGDMEPWFSGYTLWALLERTADKLNMPWPGSRNGISIASTHGKKTSVHRPDVSAFMPLMRGLFRRDPSSTQ